MTTARASTRSSPRPARLAAISLVASALGAAALIAPAPAAAAPPERPLFDPTRLHWTIGEHLAIAVPGEVWLDVGRVTEIPILVADPAGQRATPGGTSVTGRVRVEPALVLSGASWAPFSFYRLYADLDLVRHDLAVGDGRAILAADRDGRATTGRFGAMLQALNLVAASEHVAIELGLARSAWGLGLLANPGEPVAFDDDESSPFGTPRTADRNLRAQVAAFPLGRPRPDAAPPLTVALAFDAVIDDDTARFSDGDRAYQGIAAVRGHTGPVAAGFYAVHRRQRHHEGGETIVTVLDVTGRVTLVHRPGLETWLEGEGALILGSSSLAQSPTDPGAFDVGAAGGVLRFGVRAGVFTGVLEAGTASGDDNPFDDQLHTFSFDREYRVGLLLFRELLRAESAVTAANIADPTCRGAPPRGYDALATEGAVRGASYVNPRATFHITPDLRLDLGFLWAASDGDYVDAFQAGLIGGAPVGPRGARAQAGLGYELDAGLRYRLRVGEALVLEARLQGAWCRPGAVFDTARGAAADDLYGLLAELGGRF